MPGGLMQLVAYGSQDLYLSGNPEMSFYKSVYMRYSNFATQYIRLKFETIPELSLTQFTKAKIKIGQFGDLLIDTYFVIDLPAIYAPYQSGFQWVDNLAFAMIDYVTLDIEGAEIDKQHGEWMYIWNELTLSEEKKHHLHKMSSITDPPLFVFNNGPATAELKQLVYPKKRIYLPLNFWFCINPALALPLISLQRQPIYINFSFTPINNWFTIGSQNMSPKKYFQQAVEPAPFTGAPTGFPLILSNVFSIDNTFYNSIRNSFNESNIFIYFLGIGNNSTNSWDKNMFVEANYIFLDKNEKSRFAQNAQEYLIQQVQRRTFNSLPSGPSKLVVNLNHPVKELFWVFKRNDVIDNYNYHFNFTSVIDSKAHAEQLDFIEPIGQYVSTNFTSSGFLDTSATVRQVNIHYNQLLASDTNNPYNVTNNLTNVMESCKFMFNGKQRFEGKDRIFFEHLQPFKSHSGYLKYPGINNYTFALYPEDHQPSGTCNMSRLNEFEMLLTLKPPFNIDVHNNPIFFGTPHLYKNINPGTNYLTNYANTTIALTASGFQNPRVGEEIMYDMNLYATNYNILKISGGMGDISFRS